MIAQEKETVSDLLHRGFHSVVFQPICDIASGQPFAFEALMRGPESTPLSRPARVFKGDTIDMTLLHDLDRACLLSALRLGRLVGEESHLLFVNMHGETLLRFPRGTDELFELIASLHLDPHRIVLEISEMTGKAHVRAIGRSLGRLREAGVRIALDDIGARYAWLHHMLWLEPDYIKLDRQLGRAIHKSARRAKLVGSIVRLARENECEVIIEGVEEECERVALMDVGVTLGQGFLFGRPLPIQHWFSASRLASHQLHVAGLME